MNVYTHVADNLSPFYSQLIESTSGEAAYILDGLLYHETDLRPREHYADTKGYTDALFGLCHLLGFRFAPRLRDLSERRLFRMRRSLDNYPNIQSLFAAPINTRVIRDRWDDVLRLAASVESGVMPASRALRKLSAHHPEGKLYKALREVGRIDKTLFLLNFVSDPVFRRRVLVGLKKGESYHALARALVIVLGGILRSRSIEDQVNQITCLRLLATAIIAWNSVYMGEAVERLRSAGYRVDDDQLSHTSSETTARGLGVLFETDVALRLVKPSQRVRPVLLTQLAALSANLDWRRGIQQTVRDRSCQDLVSIQGRPSLMVTHIGAQTSIPLGSVW